MNKGNHQLVNAEDGTIVLSRLEIAKTFWTRFLGLQFRSAMSDQSGLMLDPCSSLHTCFMGFPIDVIMLDAHGAVVGVRRNIRPWRAVVCVRKTTRIIETTCGATNVSVGMRLRVETVS